MPMPRGPRREFVYKKELDKLAEQNRHAEESEYQDTLNNFRARVIGKIAQYGTLEPNIFLGQIYQLKGSYEDFDNPYQDMGLIVGCKKDGSTRGLPFAPYIRLIESERVDCPDGKEFMTIDASVDEEGDSQYFVSSFPNRSMPVRTEAPVVVFDPESGSIALINAVEFAPIGKVRGQRNIPDVYPFGHYSSLYDARYALGVAIAQFDKIEKLDPLITNPIKFE